MVRRRRYTLARGLSGLILLLCAYIVLGGLMDRRNPERPGVGCMIGALIVGYFAWFGLSG